MEIHPPTIKKITKSVTESPRTKNIAKANDMSSSNFDKWCKRWKISTDLIPAFNELGASVPTDLADLDTDDIEEFIQENDLKKIEAKRLRSGHQAIVEEMSRGESKEDDEDNGAPATVYNEPGHWDYFLSHTQRSGPAKSIADRLCASLKEQGFTVWLDVNMGQKGTAAMLEGVQNSRCVISIITGACVNDLSPNDPPEGNAYFHRPFCVSELEWAIEAGVQIQPVIQMENKGDIGTFLGQAPVHLKFLSDIEFIDLNRSDIDYWKVGVTKIVKATREENLPRVLVPMYEQSKRVLAEVMASQRGGEASSSFSGASAPKVSMWFQFSFFRLCLQFIIFFFLIVIFFLFFFPLTISFFFLLFPLSFYSGG